MMESRGAGQRQRAKTTALQSRETDVSIHRCCRSLCQAGDTLRVKQNPEEGTGCPGSYLLFIPHFTGREIAGNIDDPNKME